MIAILSISFEVGDFSRHLGNSFINLFIQYYKNFKFIVYDIKHLFLLFLTLILLYHRDLNFFFLEDEFLGKSSLSFCEYIGEVSKMYIKCQIMKTLGFAGQESKFENIMRVLIYIYIYKN